MINLLANERKDEIRAARVNVILLRYMAIIALAFLFIGSALYVSYSVLSSTMASTENIISVNEAKAATYNETKQQTDNLSAKLSETKTTLSQEIRYSQVLVKLGQLMPPGTILGDITLDTASFSGQPVEFKAYAKTTNEAALLQAAFQSSTLFNQPATIKNPETNEEVSGYPVTISISVVFNRAGI